MVLDGKKIAYTVVDISSDDIGKQKMKDMAGETALPPQICNGDQYCGDYAAFDEAVECETISTFLKFK